jgi:hypothetical protein
MLQRGEKTLLQTPFAREILQTPRARLKASLMTDNDAYLVSSAWIKAPDHISGRCSKASKSLKTPLKNVKSRDIDSKHYGM